jgi:monoamine oxidase
MIDRRRFLRLSAVSAPALLAPALAQQKPGAQPVVIVGAGLAGLRAADLLRRAGVTAIAFEARPYAGGRVHTVRSPFDSGLYGEAGAIRFSAAHARVLQLAREHKLPLVPFESPNGSAVTVVNGAVVRSDDIAASPFALNLRADERPLGAAGLLERYVGDLPADLADAAANAYAKWEVYDRQTWPEWLRARGASAGAIRLMTVGGDSSELSAFYVLRQIALLRKATQFFKIRGGMDQLPRAIAASLRDAVRYDAAVERIERRTDRIRIAYREQGTLKQIDASRVIVAIPFATLRHVAVSPAFSPAKARAIREMPYYPATRFLLQSRSRFWQESDANGAARTDRPAEIWDCAYDLPGTRGLIGATIGGAAGRAVGGMSADAAVKVGVDVVADAFPKMRLNFEKGVAYRWAAERWSEGAFAAFAPGQMTAMMPEVARPEGRVHFAGEHTSAWTGWMEGALESAERVVREVLEAHGA